MLLGLELFQELRSDNRHPGNGNPFRGKLHGGWSYEGTMGNAGGAILEINFKDDDAGDYTLPKLYNSKNE